ncbi:MAG: regulatory protein RecX [Candidatus Omnitrophica bacterium]|nr:regulatory protein RecX [Candidatus Omnitrophota bacterium]
MEQSQKKQAQVISLRLLAASPKTSQELKKKLQDKGFPEAMILETIRELEAQGVLSDRSYAMNLMTRYQLSKPSGRRKIEFEFKRHGIAKKLQEEILSSFGTEQEREQAETVGRERWERLAKLDTEKRRKRVFDFLMRRGFDYQIVRDVMQSLSRETFDEDR